MDTKNVGKGETLALLYMKPINNLNHKDWRCVRRINGLIKCSKKVDYWED